MQSLSNPCKPALADAGVENATDGELSTHCDEPLFGHHDVEVFRRGKGPHRLYLYFFTAIAARNEVSEPIMALDWHHSVDKRCSMIRGKSNATV